MIDRITRSRPYRSVAASVADSIRPSTDAWRDVNRIARREKWSGKGRYRERMAVPGAENETRNADDRSPFHRDARRGAAGGRAASERADAQAEVRECVRA